MLRLRSSSASRVAACGRSRGTSATERSGAVTRRRMITSTNATSMMGVTLTLVISSEPGTARRRILPPHHGDLRSAGLARHVEHGDEGPVRDTLGASHDDVPGGARLHEASDRLYE